MSIINPQGLRIYEAAFSLHSIRDPAAVANHLLIAPQTLREWCSHGIPDHCIEYCAARLNCDELWLLMGLGCMTRTASNDASAAIDCTGNGWESSRTNDFSSHHFHDASEHPNRGERHSGENACFAGGLWQEPAADPKPLMPKVITLRTVHPEMAVSEHIFSQAVTIVASASMRFAPEHRTALAKHLGSLVNAPPSET